MRETKPTASTKPRADAEPVRLSTANESATGTSALPSSEVVRPSQRRRKFRSRSAAPRRRLAREREPDDVVASAGETNIARRTLRTVANAVLTRGGYSGRTAGADLGSRTTNVVPRPTALSTLTEPSIASVSSFTIARPSPVPTARFVP